MNSDRKLATILATDCVNFSKHMEENEEKTLRNLNECRKIIDAKIIEFGGRIFKTEGDSVVCEFASPVNCLKAAMEFQNEIYKRNDHSITELKLEWRVGIHVDDVIVEGDNIMGSGVNVSARLESECEPGGILISTIVKDQVNKRLDAKIENDGTRNLKNISENFEVYKISNLLIHEDDFLTEEEKLTNDNIKEPIAQTKINKAKKIKLAILPFENLSKDEDSEFLVEGVFRDLIQEFSRMQEFEILSHQTSMDFKKSDEDALGFAKKHLVDYLIGGNIRSAGKRIRVSVDLTDASDGANLWGEKYDRVMEDIFDLQDEIVMKMSRQLLGNIEISSLQRIKRKPSENLNSYEWLIKGTYHHVRSGKENNLKAIEALDKAIEIDENLFQERGGKAKIAFQENESGKINGMIFDVYPFMSMYKASMWKGQSFNFLFIGLSVIVFLGVILRLAYQWSIYKSLPKEEKDATTSAIVAAGLNLGFFIFGIIALSVDGDTLFSIGFTPLMKFWLLFPILATIAGGYQIYQAVIVWKNNYWGIWKRIRFSIISLCCLFMIWFYYYWNILGYNYL